MDFPVCPSCKQSVIDDDAVDCPFCGASMKSKPGTKAATATPAAPAAAKPAATAASKATAVKPGSAKPTLPGDDFPFEVELTAGKAAIQAMPNPTKQRSLKVVCKMCDTAGYVPPSAAGQEVRCANPKCVMPVFTAPAPKKVEVAPPPPPPKSSNLPFVAGATILLMGTVLGGLYFVFSLPGRTGSVSKEMDEEAMKMMQEMGGSKKNVKAPPGKKEVPAEQKKEEVVAAPATKSVDKDALIKSALSQMKDSSLEKVAQRSKAYCRQLAAEACAVTGQSAAFREHLDQLMKVGNDVTYYRIIPMLDLFWVDLAAGNKKASANSLDTAMSEVPKIPKFGRTRLEIAGRVMVALVVSGKQDEALKLMSEFQASDADAQLAARLQIAFDGRISPLSDRLSVLPWKYPQAVAVTGSLINRGHMDLAAQWASSQSSDDAKAECLAYWAEETAKQNAAAGTADVNGAIAASIASLPPALASRVWSRAGCGRMRAGDEAGVLAAIKLAQEKLGEISKPAECKMPTVKLAIDFKLPAEGPLLQAATAAGELTNLQAQLAKTKSDAENSLDLALSFADAIAPSSAVAHQRQDDVKRMGKAGLEKLMKDELKKKNDDDARRAANAYTRSLNEISKAAQIRFDTETELLSRLRGAGVGLDLKVWIIVNARTTAQDIEKRDNFFTTTLPGELREGLKGTAEEQAILGAWGVNHSGSEPPKPISVEFNRKLETDPSAAVEYLTKAEPKANRREEIELMAASRLTMENKLSTAFAFIGKMKHDDIVDRENCYRLAASLASQKGQADEVWKQVANIRENTEKVALCRGMIAGLLASR